MATPQCLVELKQKALGKGWGLEQIPHGVRLHGYNGVPVANYGGGFWALSKYNVLALDADAAELAGQIRTALTDDYRKSERERKLALKRGERRGRPKLKRA
jgi:hypothetical protein